MASDEVVTHVRFHRFADCARTAFLESSRRSGDFATAGVAVAVTMADGVIASAKAAFVSVTDVPLVLDLTPEVRGEGPQSRWAGAIEAVREFVTPDADIHASADYRPRPDGGDRMSHAHPASEDTEALHIVTVRVNGVARTASVPARRLLSDFLRADLGLTGTHVGCEHGVCGACTVLVDGAPMRSCLMFAISAMPHEITTVEGLGDVAGSVLASGGERLSPVQAAFAECHALQCGFCTPGFLTTVTAYLADNPDPTPEAARAAISGNLCRCTGYQNIVKAVCRAAELRRALPAATPEPNAGNAGNASPEPNAGNAGGASPEPSAGNATPEPNAGNAS